MSTHSSTTTLKLAGPSLSLWRKFTTSISLKRNSPSENIPVSPATFQDAPNISIPNPPPSVYHSAARASTSDVLYTIPSNAFDSFFGSIRDRSSFSSTRAPSPTSTLPPPYSPYGTSAAPDVYANQEPPTLARFFFLYGFIFFPFWILGILILVSPLRPTPDWEDGKTELEREQLLKLLRSTEKKWGYRCLSAFLVLAVAVIILAINIRYHTSHTKSQ